MANKKSNKKGFNEGPKTRAALSVICALLVCAIVAVGLVGYYSSGFQDWARFQKEDSATNITDAPSDEALDLDVTNSDRVLLSVANAVAESGFPTKTLTATVLPEDAPNKLVDWSVRWTSLSETADVSEYLTLETADGSNVAVITCIKDFKAKGDIIVEVKTRDGGFTALCNVTFTGVPTSISLDLSGLSEKTSAELGTYYELTTANAGSVGITLSNIFGSVGAEYNVFHAEITGIGSITVRDHVIDVRNGAYYNIANKKDITLDSIKNDILDATVTGNTLNINLKKLIRNYFKSSENYMDGAHFVGYAYKEAYSPDDNDTNIKTCAFTIKITASNGVNTTIKVVPVASVTSVNVSSSTITF